MGNGVGDDAVEEHKRNNGSKSTRVGHDFFDDSLSNGVCPMSLGKVLSEVEGSSRVEGSESPNSSPKGVARTTLAIEVRLDNEREKSA